MVVFQSANKVVTVSANKIFLGTSQTSNRKTQLTWKTDLGGEDDKHYGELLEGHLSENQQANAVELYFCSINKLHNEIEFCLCHEQREETYKNMFL